MKQYIKCYSCMSHGFVSMGVGFQTTRCKLCHGTGHRTIYIGDFAKEEKQEDDRRARESLQDDYQHGMERARSNDRTTRLEDI